MGRPESRAAATAVMIGRTLALIIAVAGTAGAQATLTGHVRDSTGRALADVTISIDALKRTATTDSAGRYLLADLPAGPYTVRAKHLGFELRHHGVQLTTGETQLDFVLAATVVPLDSIVSRDVYSPTDQLMTEYVEHKKAGVGRFITRQDLEQMGGEALGVAFRNLPGFRVLTGAMGDDQAWIASSSMRITVDEVELEDQRCLKSDTRAPHGCARLEETQPTHRAWATLCFPAVYLDAAPLSILQVPNINRLKARDLEAVEIFRNSAEIPHRYATTRNTCGAIIFHALRDR